MGLSIVFFFAEEQVPQSPFILRRALVILHGMGRWKLVIGGEFVPNQTSRSATDSCFHLPIVVI